MTVIKMVLVSVSFLSNNLEIKKMTYTNLTGIHKEDDLY